MATSFKGGCAWWLCQDLRFGELIGGDGRRWESVGNWGLFAQEGSFNTVTGSTPKGQRGAQAGPCRSGSQETR